MKITELADIAAELTSVRRRSRVLGVPIGPKRVDWIKVAQLAGGAVATAAGSAGVAKVTSAAGRRIAGLVGSGGDDGDDAGGKGGSGGEAEQKGKRDAKASEQDETREQADGEDQDESDQEARDDARDEAPADNLTKLRLIICEQIDVAVPRRVAYNQWTQFEDFPTIFRTVRSVEQGDDDAVSWKVRIGPATRKWKSRIIEQDPDERIAWISTGRIRASGVVSFHRLDDNLTRIHLEMEYRPKGIAERTGNLLLLARRRARKELRLFKHYLEMQGRETGAWRGEISDHGHLVPKTADAKPDKHATIDLREHEPDDESSGSRNGDAAQEREPATSKAASQ